MTSIDLQTIREEQLAFFLERITGEQARTEWQAHVAAAIETWLETPLEKLTTPEALTRAVEAAMARESFTRAIRPISKHVHMESIRSARKERTKVGHYVPKEAREKIEAVLGRPNKGAERLLRQVLAQDAMEETMRDVLYDALKEFNEKVNPFVADWGLPGILKKLGPFGFGPLAKSIDGVRTEFDRRLEPEMRKFLQGFSRKALDKTGDLMSKNSGSSAGKWGDLRRAVIQWVYDQEVRELMGDVDDEGASLGHGAVLDVIEHSQSLPDVKKRRQDAISAFFAQHGKDPLRKVLAHHGGAPVVDTRAISDATWPAVKALLSSDPVKTHVKTLLDEFWDAFTAGG